MMEKREKASNLLLLICIAFFIFSLLQVIAPLVHPAASITQLSGMTVMVDNEQVWTELNHPWQDMYLIGDVLCHTKESRSFFLNQNQLPFCARCTSIWFGLTIGLAISIFYQIRKHMIFFFCFIASIGLLGVDGVGQLFGLWESTNLLRFITGIIVGIFTGLAIGLITDEIQEMNKKKNEILR